MRRGARRLPTARPPCNQASSVLGSPQSPAHMARDDPDRASTNEAKWMWTIYTPCLLLFRHPGGIPRHYLFVSPSPVLRPSSLSSSVVSCSLASSDNLQPQQSHSSEGDCLGQKLFCLCLSFFWTQWINCTRQLVRQASLGNSASFLPFSSPCVFVSLGEFKWQERAARPCAANPPALQTPYQGTCGNTKLIFSALFSSF